MSCIYGPHQRGTEDQGWLAHFLLQALAEKPITIFGDGYQVRDVLFIDDLVEAFMLAERHAGRLSGQAFNLGGGPENTLSLLELIDTLEDLLDCRLPLRYGDWRHGDQRYYVTDTRKFARATGWEPKTGVEEGLQRLHAWLTGRPAPVRAIVGL
jgi:CDP-paratose 2-epimerase